MKEIYYIIKLTGISEDDDSSYTNEYTYDKRPNITKLVEVKNKFEKEFISLYGDTLHYVGLNVYEYEKGDEEKKEQLSNSDSK